MTSLEYILKLFSTSAQVLGVPFIKTTPKKLQHWAEKNKPPFIALLDLAETNEKVRNNYLPSYNLAFVCVAASIKDANEEQITQSQIDADKLCKEFRYLIDSNRLVNTTSFDSEELFRDGVYLGVGKGFTMSIQLPDLNDYCVLDCNTETQDIRDCNE